MILWVLAILVVGFCLAIAVQDYRAERAHRERLRRRGA